jgi:hypothetical protein
VFDIDRYPARVLILFLILVIPVCRLLLQEDYGLLHKEVAAAVLLLLGLAAGLAALGRWRPIFHAQVIILSILLSVNAVQVDLTPNLKVRWIIAGLGLLLIGAILILRSRFYPVLLIFLAGSFAVDVIEAVAEGAGKSWQTAQREPGRRYQHVIHLVFDEMIGFAGMPSDCRSCVQAGAMLKEVLARGNFRIYPYAFSNYRGTKDSIPSILDDRLLTRTLEYFPQTDPRPYLRRNKYFSRHIEKGYAVRVYESDYLLYSAPEFPGIVTRRYRVNSLTNLRLLGASWSDLLYQLGVIYLQSDRLWWNAWTRFLSPRWHPEKFQHVGPLAARKVWPGPLLADCRAASKNTLFFAHLLTPHHPYVYGPDGSIRVPDEWPIRSRLDFYQGEAEEYRRRYELYGEQAQFVARQLNGFFEGLRSAGLYDDATIVVHGDHGARLRLLNESEREYRDNLESTAYCWAVNRYDYLGPPDMRDLLNRYSALLAIKLPGASASEVIEEKASVLYFLRRAFGKGTAPSDYDALNSVYLFRADGSPEAIPILKLWRTDK